MADGGCQAGNVGVPGQDVVACGGVAVTAGCVLKESSKPRQGTLAGGRKIWTLIHSLVTARLTKVVEWGY